MHNFEITSIHGFTESRGHAQAILYKIGSRLNRKIGHYHVIDVGDSALLLRLTGLAEILPRFLSPLLYKLRCLGYDNAMAINYSFYDGEEGKHLLISLWGKWPNEIRLIAASEAMTYARAYGSEKIMIRVIPFYFLSKGKDWTA